MKEQKRDEKDWPKRLQSHCQSCQIALNTLKQLKEKQVNSKKISQFLRQLEEEITEITREADWLNETLVVGPIEKMFSTDRINLSEQQYYILRASGLDMFSAKGLGISSVDDCEVYQNCVYEDEKKVCFLDPNETPEVETVDVKTGIRHIRLRIAYSPEELNFKDLQPEQKEFFAKYRPDVLERIQKNPSDSVEKLNA